MLEASEDLELREAFNLFDADGDGQVIFNIYNLLIFNGTTLIFKCRNYTTFYTKTMIINFYFI